MSDHNSPPPPSPRRRPNSPPSPALPRPTSFTPPPRRPPPMMGIPGQSAFRPYNRPMRAHRMSWPTSRSLFRPYRPPLPPPPAPVPVMGSASGSLLQLPPPHQMTWKRPREGEEGSGSGAAEGGGGEGNVKCSVCGRTFRTDKALFGHMRSHPARGWKGAHPPPAFSAEEEYADIRNMAAGVGQNLAADRGVEEGGDGCGGRELPDLNDPPPPDSEHPQNNSP